MIKNTLQKILLENIEEKWTWEILSMNSNITLEFIEKYSYLPWSGYFLSFNYNITIDFLENYSNSFWNWWT